VLTGKAKVELQYDPASASLVKIITDDVKSGNYKPLNRIITIVETIDGETPIPTTSH